MISSKSRTSHVLLTLGVLFSVAGIARFLPVAAKAENTAGAGGSDYATSAAAVTEASAAVSALSATVAPNTDTLCLSAEAAAALNEDLTYIETEREALIDRQLQLSTLEAELDQRAAALGDLQARLNTRWDAMQTSSNEDLSHLSKMYESMKPSQAAAIFDQMDSSFAAGLLRMIASDQAGLILAGMSPENSYIVSIELANMNADLR